MSDPTPIQDSLRESMTRIETQVSGLATQVSQLVTAISSTFSKPAQPRAGILTSNFATFAVIFAGSTWMLHDGMITGELWAAINGFSGLGYMGFRTKQIEDARK